MSKNQGITHDNIIDYLGMIESMINDMIKQYAYYLAQNMDENDPTSVTLNNILMVAPKTEQINYQDMSFIDVPKDDEELGGLENADSRPLTMKEF